MCQAYEGFPLAGSYPGHIQSLLVDPTFKAGSVRKVSDHVCRSLEFGAIVNSHDKEFNTQGNNCQLIVDSIVSEGALLPADLGKAGEGRLNAVFGDGESEADIALAVLAQGGSRDGHQRGFFNQFFDGSDG